MLYCNDYWSECKICGLLLEKMPIDIKQRYKINKFKKHLKEIHDLSAESYFEKMFNLSFPLCDCGCGLKVGFKPSNKNAFEFCSVIIHHIDKNSEKYRKMIARLSLRVGDKNPNFGKKPWNKGLTKDNSESLMVVSQKLTGRSISKKTKDKQSLSAKKRLIHGHTGFYHSEYTKSIIRENTLRMIKEGRFSHIKTKPHLEMARFLSDLKLDYIEEYYFGVYSWDFYIPSHKLFIEVDGDYFHSNPKFFKDGPKSPTQIVNHYRDLRKDSFAKENKIKLLRFWEDDILNIGNYIKEIIRTNL